MGEEEKIEHLILTNPVYPKPSDIVISIQKMFKKFDVWVGRNSDYRSVAGIQGQT